MGKFHITAGPDMTTMQSSEPGMASITLISLAVSCCIVFMTAPPLPIKFPTFSAGHNKRKVSISREGLKWPWLAPSWNLGVKGGAEWNRGISLAPEAKDAPWAPELRLWGGNWPNEWDDGPVRLAGKDSWSRGGLSKSCWVTDWRAFLTTSTSPVIYTIAQKWKMLKNGNKHEQISIMQQDSNYGITILYFSLLLYVSITTKKA